MQRYLVAFFLFFLATARRSIFFRRRARFLTLSLPWLCPIGVNTRPSSAGSKAISSLHLKFRFLSHSAASAARPLIGVVAALLVLAATVATLVWFLRRPAPLVSTIPEKSIAVLPFENRSEDKANAYFSDGIQNEILTRLSKIADLKVISRTSTQHYQSAPTNLPEIANQLGVAHILEGSVQKSGDVVRVNVQLIKAATDSHLWADTFDRKLTDIF